MSTNDDNESVDSFEHNKLTKSGDVDSVDSSSEQSTGKITALIGPQGPSHAEIRVNANEMIARVDARIVQDRERWLTNMDAETQRYQVQVEASRQALIKQQETQVQASRFATPKKGRTPKHKSRFQAHRVSADHFTPLKDKKSGIQAPGSNSMTPHDRIVKSLRKENKETREHIHDDLVEFKDDLKKNINMNVEKEHRHTRQDIKRNVSSEHAKTRRDNRVEMNQMEDRIMSKLAEQHAEQSRRLDEYMYITWDVTAPSRVLTTVPQRLPLHLPLLPPQESHAE